MEFYSCFSILLRGVRGGYHVGAEWGSMVIFFIGVEGKVFVGKKMVREGVKSGKGRVGIVFVDR